MSFHSFQTVGDLIKAEKILQTRPNFSLWCEGIELPPWVFLQDRTYHLSLGASEFLAESLVIPIVLEHLRHRSLFLLPAGMTCGSFTCWADIPNHAQVVDGQDEIVVPSQVLMPWQVVTVQQHQDDVDFELTMKLSGYGPGDLTDLSTHLTVSDSRCTAGLWHLDQLVKSELMLSWLGASFAPLTCWLPSFAAAVLEWRPSTKKAQLQSWLAEECTRIFAIVWEPWGWNLSLICSSVLCKSPFMNLTGMHPLSRRNLQVE